MNTKDLARIARATKRVELEQMRSLAARFGDRCGFLDGMACHHLDHGLVVAAGAEADVRLLIAEGRRLPVWAPFAARVAGLFHDHVQNEGPGRNEDLSIEAARAALRCHPEFDEAFVGLVEEGIDATKVLELDVQRGRIVQNAGRGQHFRAALADADLVAWGSPDSTYQALELYVELHRDALDVPEWATLHDVDPDRASAASWLLEQIHLRRSHRYLLDLNAGRLAHQRLNADELRRYALALRSGELTWRELVHLATPLEQRLGG